MLLTYIDESGINYKKEKNVFIDGPFIVWGGLLVPEQKYFPLERLFYDLIKKKLKIKDWEEIEIHATDIWFRQGKFQNLSEKSVREYFEELAQLLAKLDIKIILGIKKKSLNLRSPISKNKEISKAVYGFLHTLEHELAKQNETSVVIADDDSEKSGLSLLDQLYFERTRWRYNPGAKKTTTLKSRFFFESRACFLLDQVHHTKSSRSLFVQIADNTTFLIRKVLQHSYYYHNKNLGINADIKKVPITTETFGWLSRKIEYGWFSEKYHDVIMGNLENDVTPNESYLQIRFVNGGL